MQWTNSKNRTHSNQVLWVRLRYKSLRPLSIGTTSCVWRLSEAGCKTLPAIHKAGHFVYFSNWFSTHWTVMIVAQLTIKHDIYGVCVIHVGPSRSSQIVANLLKNCGHLSPTPFGRTLAQRGLCAWHGELPCARFSLWQLVSGWTAVAKWMIGTIMVEETTFQNLKTLINQVGKSMKKYRVCLSTYRGKTGKHQTYRCIEFLRFLFQNCKHACRRVIPRGSFLPEGIFSTGSVGTFAAVPSSRVASASGGILPSVPAGSTS